MPKTADCLAEGVEFELSGNFLNGQYVMKKRQEVLRRLASRSLWNLVCQLATVISPNRLARLCIYKNGTVSSKLLRFRQRVPYPRILRPNDKIVLSDRSLEC